MTSKHILKFTFFFSILFYLLSCSQSVANWEHKVGKPAFDGYHGQVDYIVREEKISADRTKYIYKFRKCIIYKIVDTSKKGYYVAPNGHKTKILGYTVGWGYISNPNKCKVRAPLFG